jgi:nucleotide-binding universal stress UspA family protein
MFKRILVPLDGSTLAERAIPVAARLAHAAGGTVILLQVVAVPVETGKVPIIIYDQQAIDKHLDAALDYLARVAQSSMLADCAVEVQSLSGATAPSIISALPSLQADVIVMCSHGYTSLKRWMLGSVTQKVARHSPIPVMILREEKSSFFEQKPAAEHPMVALVSLDGSSLSETAIAPAAEILAALAAPDKAVLHLLEVVSLPPVYGHLRSQTPFDAEIKAREMQEAEAYLKSVKERLSQKFMAYLNLTITTSIVVDADIAEAIVQTANQGQSKEDHAIPAANFIAMATHGRGGLPRWIMGSVTERVLHAAPLPLLIVRPQAMETQHDTKDAGMVREEIFVEEVFEMSLD